MEKYIDKYTFLMIKIDSIENSNTIQKLLFNIGVYWHIEDKDHIFNDSECFYAIDIKNKKINVTNNTEYLYYLDDSNKKFYDINNLKKIKDLIEYGYLLPNYKPKKIQRIL